MSCQDKVSRIIVKRSFTAGEKPTIPPNEDHRSGLWSATDIYIGEQFLNVVDGKLYTRSNAGIEDVATSSSNGLVMYKARIIQSGAEAPTLKEFINNVGTITPSRTAVGTYNLSGFGTLLTNTNNLEVELSVGGNASSGNANCFSANPNVLVIESFDNTFTLTDGVLNNSSFVARWHTITIIKY